MLTHAVAFLHAEYRAEFFCWELLELMRKLTLTGFVLLIPQTMTLLRLTIALLITIGHLVLLQQAAPYKQRFTAHFAVATSLTLTCTLLMAALIKMYDELPASRLEQTLGFRDAFPLTVIILIFNFSVLIVAAMLICLQAREVKRGMAVRRLRFVARGDEVLAPSLGRGMGFHLFLSHCWGTGQDQMRIVKQRLMEMVPDLRIFLDVDDLQGMDLENYVERSLTVLVFCSAGYCESKNCMRELVSASASRKPLIALLELDARHGSVTMQQMRDQLATTTSSPSIGGSGATNASSGAVLADALFAAEPIEWNRLLPYQDVTLRLIAQRLLPPPVRPTFVQGELMSRAITLPALESNGIFHVYCSRHNQGALEVVREAAEERGLHEQLRVSSDSAQLLHCEAMLIYLTSATWTSGRASDALALEVEEVMATDCH